jgi:formylglycine-generating enzyme required for sulfatase activity
MPPEQAEGRIADIDERSDIYSLGAILYEILTFRPPYEGTTPGEILTKVLSADMVAPSQRVSQIGPGEVTGPAYITTFVSLSGRPESDEGTGSREDEAPGEDRVNVVTPDPVPPELDEIVLRALAREKDKRYPGARVLGEDIQAFLEGEKQRERNRLKALEKVEEGQALAESVVEMREELEALDHEAEEKFKEFQHHWPMEKKREIWKFEDRWEELRLRMVQTFGDAAAAFQEALGFERENAGARAGLADLYWEQFLQEEKASEKERALYFESLVRKYNDGQYDERLKGDGTLTLGTRRYTCPCLSEGREVDPAEYDLAGYHMFSGRALDGQEGAEGLPDLEPSGPVRLRVHGPACRTESLQGADVWIFRYEEKEKILLPVLPEGADTPSVPPAEVLERLFGADSPHRPSEGLNLGRTPLEGVPLPMGSYLLIAAAPGFHPVRVPIHVERLGDVTLDLTLYREGEIPEGFVQVSGGGFHYQGDRGATFAVAEEQRRTDDFFLARFPATCGEYAAFLNQTAEQDPRAAARRVPRVSEDTGYYWPRGPDGRYAVPTVEWLASIPPEIAAQVAKLKQTDEPWVLEWPVMGISWEDAMSWCAWLSDRSGYLVSLPTDVLWERAARGADRRAFPWGDGWDSTFENSQFSQRGKFTPSPVDSFPVDESPFGVRGLGGNSCDWCLNFVESGKRRHLRGGGWLNTGTSSRLGNRWAYAPNLVSHWRGFRACICPSTVISESRH